MKPKKLIYFLLSIFIISALFFCKAKKDNSNNPLNVLLRLFLRDASSSALYSLDGIPSQVNVVIPRSIRKTETSTTVSGNIRNLRASTGQPHAEGLSSLQDTTEKVEALLFDTIHDFILLSEMKKTVQAESGTCFVGGTKEITITQEMLNLIKAYLMKFGKTESEALALITEKQNSGTLPTVGTKVPSPTVVYNSNQEGYDHEFVYSLGQNVKSKAKCPSDISNKKSFDKILRFNGELTKSFLAMKKTYSFLGLDIISVATILHESVGDNLNHRNVLTIKTTLEESGRKTSKVFRAKLEECNKTSSDESCLKMDTVEETRLPNLNQDTSTSSNTKGYDLKVEVNGISNTQGGFLIVTRYDPQGNKECFKEAFSEDGTLKGYAKSCDCKNYITPPTYSGLAIDYNDGFISGYVNESLAFNGIVYVKLNSLSITASNYDGFIIMKDGVDLSTVENPYDYIIGYGSYVDINGNGSAEKDEVFIDYFGTEAEISGAKIYHESWSWSDTTQEYTPSYTLLNNSIVKDNAPSAAMENPFESATIDDLLEIALASSPSSDLLNIGGGYFLIFRGGTLDTSDYNNQIGEGFWDDTQSKLTYNYYYGTASEIPTAELYIYDPNGTDYDPYGDSISPIGDTIVPAVAAACQ
ncbi:MAG: hypothetical protein KDK90_16525 [Leptospiraceae bacterium]|nr:hypothetical protein [Leptospiraceae bacterium]